MRVRAASSSSRRRSCGMPDRAEDVGEAVVRAGRRDLEVAARLDPVVAHPAHGVRDLVVGGRDGAALTGRDDLARVKREAAEHAEAAARPSARARAERARRVLEQRDASGTVATSAVPVERPAEQVDREHRPRALGDGVGHLREIEVHRRGVDVDEHRPRARERDDVRGRRERVRRDDHLVAGPDPEREHREVERCGPGRDRHRVRHLAGLRERLLELGDLRPHRQVAALEHLRDRARLLDADVGSRQPDRLVSHAGRRGCRARAGPSSSSRSVSIACSGVITIGSFSLNEVLSTIGTPVGRRTPRSAGSSAGSTSPLDRLQAAGAVDVGDGRDRARASPARVL